jgi:hypothetical protein
MSVWGTFPHYVPGCPRPECQAGADASVRAGAGRRAVSAVHGVFRGDGGMTVRHGGRGAEAGPAGGSRAAPGEGDRRRRCRLDPRGEPAHPAAGHGIRAAHADPDRLPGTGSRQRSAADAALNLPEESTPTGCAITPRSSQRAARSRTSPENPRDRGPGGQTPGRGVGVAGVEAPRGRPVPHSARRAHRNSAPYGRCERM